MPQSWQTNANGALFRGIDHSAISVSDTARSIAFYEGLGLSVSTRSLNWGREQEALDDVAGVAVEVTALAPHHPNPHLELLCYCGGSADRNPIRSNADVAATRLIFSATGAVASHQFMDPDGHRLLIEGAARQAGGVPINHEEHAKGGVSPEV